MNIYLGNKDNKEIYEDLNNLKNMLIAGGPVTGKTTYFRRIIKELVSNYSPNEVKFMIYDSKGIDYQKYNESPYLLFPITKDVKINEFKEQFLELRRIAKDRLVSNENKPAIVVLIDEIYMLAYWFTECIKEIADLAKDVDKTNIHFFISTQRPYYFGTPLNKAFNTKICYWLFNEEEAIHFINTNECLTLNECGETLVSINGKLEKLKQILI